MDSSLYEVHNNSIVDSVYSAKKKSEIKLFKAFELSIVVPFYNEKEVLPEFHKRLDAVLENLSIPSEIIYINDGSTDSSQNIVENLESKSSEIRCIVLSRNFGKEAAVSAGLDYSYGKAVIILDADLQDPPELIPQMLEKWYEGYDIVNMQRKERRGETWFKKFSAKCFYRIINSLSQIDIPENVGDFRLLDYKVVEHINMLTEKNRYMKGILSWPGFNQCILPFDRETRHKGKTKWNYFNLFGLAFDGIVSFSNFPLKLSTFIGVLLLILAFYNGALLIYESFVHDYFFNLASENNFLLFIILLLSGIQLLSIGILGEYVGRLFIEAKQRPLYIVQSVTQIKGK